MQWSLLGLFIDKNNYLYKRIDKATAWNKQYLSLSLKKTFSVLKKRACFAPSLNKHYYTPDKSTGTQPFRVSVSVLVYVYSSQCLQAKKTLIK